MPDILGHPSTIMAIEMCCGAAGRNCSSNMILQGWPSPGKPTCKQPKHPSYTFACPPFDITTGPGSPVPDFNKASGLTADAKALDAICTAMQCSYNPWPHPVPCLFSRLGISCGSNMTGHMVMSGFDTILLMQNMQNPAWSMNPALVPEFANLTQLTSLTISGSSTIGATLPAAWSKLTSLQYLNLPNNGLVGTVPAAWSALTALEIVQLPGNNLSGSLPTLWGSARVLDVSSNMFGGTIPDAWSSSGRFVTLKLNQNQLTGTLPVLNTSTWLGVLDLSENALTGTLPESWSQLKNLYSVDLHSNKLNGSLPATVSHRNTDEC